LLVPVDLAERRVHRVLLEGVEPTRRILHVTRYIYVMQRVRKTHQDKLILDDVTLAFLPGAKIGVVGPNGAGKSTVLEIMAGLETISNGEATLAPGATVGILLQEPRLDPGKDVLGNVEEGVAATRALLHRFEELGQRLGEAGPGELDRLLDEYAKVQDAIEAAGAWDLDAQLDMAMDALRLPPGDADVTTLSGGERRRAALCRLLLQRPDLLLLDEPTNHLDAESVQWLEQHLAAYPGTVLAVTHDRYFLDNVAGWILELDRGRAYPYEGNYSTYLETKAARLAAEARASAGRRRVLQRELEWVRAGTKGRHAKGRARLRRYEELAAEAERDRPIDFDEIQIPPGPRLGDVVVAAEGLSKGYGDRLLVEGLSFSLPRGGIVGVIGANGAGKTTLVRMITGEERPDAGRLRLGPTVKLAYVDQDRARLGPGKTVFEAISGGLDHFRVGGREMPTRAYVATFGFKGSDQQKPVEVLSGGERNRLNLALTLREGGNLLLLDEPTNDLDVDTLRSLESALLDFPGCAVVISHDRWFLDRVATHVLAFEGDSQAVWFEGNYADYQADKVGRLGTEAARPHRVTYRKLVRD
jgi:ATP-binding cassette ChvD family protein